ncbi:MAG: antibiotic biosynthesis monooxygenase [Pseudonocardiaceae bacterium]
MILICHFSRDAVDTVGQSRDGDFPARARGALQLLSAQAGCRGGQLARSPDDTTRWVLVVQFESVVAYRRALSVFEVREQVVPLLSEAVPGESGGYEVLATAEYGAEGAVIDHASLLSADAERGFHSGAR